MRTQGLSCKLNDRELYQYIQDLFPYSPLFAYQDPRPYNSYLSNVDWNWNLGTLTFNIFRGVSENCGTSQGRFFYFFIFFIFFFFFFFFGTLFHSDKNVATKNV